MLYPRTDFIDGKEALVHELQMVGYKEHMFQKHRVMYLTGVITGEVDSRHLLMTLDSLSHEPIKIFITSAGGDLDSTFLFYDTIKMIESPVIIIGEYCASAAAILLASGSKRYLYPHAKTMLHLPAGQMGGDARDWDIQVKQMNQYKNRVVDILKDCGATKDREEILNDMDRDFWMDADETIQYGLADGILTKDILKNLINNKGGV